MPPLSGDGGQGAGPTEASKTGNPDLGDGKTSRSENAAMALILLIDDSEFARSLTAKVLQKAGHQILEASDGLQGLKLLGDSTPDCIVCDLLMPAMDGQKFLMALRAVSLEIPVLVLTADVQDRTHAFCLEWGASEVIYKPPREEVLLAAVGRAIGKETAT